MYKSVGGCHCGNITFEMEVTQDPSSYNPRRCDCDFCSKHGAAYISDNNGKLMVSVKNQTNLSKYRQGSGIAEFLSCKECGVLIGACYEKEGQLYAAINSKAVDRNTNFGQEIVVSPKELSDNVKTQRWRDIWFADVSIKYVNA